MRSLLEILKISVCSLRLVHQQCGCRDVVVSSLQIAALKQRQKQSSEELRVLCFVSASPWQARRRRFLSIPKNRALIRASAYPRCMRQDRAVPSKPS